MCRWLGWDSVRLDLEGHRREALFDDIDVSRTMGPCFTALYQGSETGHPDEAGAQHLRLSITRRMHAEGRGIERVEVDDDFVALSEP